MMVLLQYLVLSTRGPQRILPVMGRLDRVEEGPLL